MSYGIVQEIAMPTPEVQAGTPAHDPEPPVGALDVELEVVVAWVVVPPGADVVPEPPPLFVPILLRMLSHLLFG